MGSRGTWGPRSDLQCDFYDPYLASFIIQVSSPFVSEITLCLNGFHSPYESPPPS